MDDWQMPETYKTEAGNKKEHYAVENDENRKKTLLALVKRMDTEAKLKLKA